MTPMLDKIDRNFLENIFGTDLEVEDINNIIQCLEEWKVELQDDNS